MSINGEKSLYNQFVETLSKIDESNRLIKELTNTVKDQSQTITSQAELIEKLLLEIDRLKNQINKNSSNSSKPGSTDGKPPKSGANLYNGRVKSGKSVGGQRGHKGHNLSKLDVEAMVEENDLIVKVVNHTIKGDANKPPIIKYKLGMEVIPYVEKHIFDYDNESLESLPKEFYTDVTYDEHLKSICIELGAYNVVAIDRLSDFLSVITNGVINISNGTICNFYEEFSFLSKQTIDDLIEEILNQKLMYTDETGAKLNKMKIYFRNYSTEKIAIFKAHLNKGHKPIKEDNVLPRFLGGIMGDHDTALYSYGSYNYECNTHSGRYLEEISQNITYVSWTIELKALFTRINESIKLAKLYGLERFEEIKIKEYVKDYDRILDYAKEENKTIKSSFYKDKAKTLLNRMVKYKENHLAFIKDFNVPFSNNLSEQDLRIVKTKTKVSGGFRSFNGAIHYANALTIIKTAKKRNINPFSAITNIFLKKPCFE